MRYKCIDRNRNKQGKIISYILMDEIGNKVLIEAEKLREELRNNNVDIINLKITKDGRIITKEETIVEKLITNKVTEERIQSITNKARILGANVNKIDTPEGSVVLISLKDDQHILFISDNITKLDKALLKENQKGLTRGRMHVVGGRNLRVLTKLFSNQILNTLDLTKLNMNNLERVNNLFENSDIRHIKFGKVNAQKLTNIDEMFARLTTSELDLTDLTLPNIYSMQKAFYKTIVKFTKGIKLGKFNTSNVKYFNNVFELCVARSIDFNGIDTSNCIAFEKAFMASKIGHLDLSNLNLEHVGSMRSMFNYATVFELNFGKHKLKDLESISEMFRSANIIGGIDLGGLEFEQLKSAIEAFKGCRTNNTINISSIDLDSIDMKDGMFKGCRENLIIGHRTYEGGILSRIGFEEFLGNIIDNPE